MATIKIEFDQMASYPKGAIEALDKAFATLAHYGVQVERIVKL